MSNIEDFSDDDFDKYMNTAIAANSEPEIDEEVEVDSIDEEIEVDSFEEEEEIVEEEDEGIEDTEQPEDDADLEDSDNDEVEDEYEEDETEEEPEEAEDANDAEDDTPEEESTEPESKDTEVQEYKIRANGVDYEFTAEELVKLAPKALDYTRKMQDIAPYRKRISAMEEQNVTDEQFNLMLDVLNGDKDALSTVLKNNGVDALDLDVENSVYTPKDYGRNETELAIDDIVDTISRDQEYVTTQFIVDKAWDSASRQEFVKDPNKIALLHDDVKSGVYDKVSPLATKLKALDGGKKSDMEYYIEAGTQFYAKQESTKAAEIEAAKVAEAEKIKVAEAKKATEKRTTVKKAANKRKAAATTKVSGGKKKVTNYLDNDALSDDDFVALMNKQIRKG